MLFYGIAKGGTKINGVKKDYVIQDNVTIVSGEWVSLSNNKVIKYNGTLLGVATQSGQGGKSIKVITPQGA